MSLQSVGCVYKGIDGQPSGQENGNLSVRTEPRKPCERLSRRNVIGVLSFVKIRSRQGSTCFPVPLSA